MKLNILILLNTVFALLGTASFAQATNGFGTLFTTQSERTIINDNRYIVKKKAINKVAAVVEEVAEEPEPIIYKTVEKKYKLSGISIANNGVDSAWINDKLYEDGESIDKNTKIKINLAKQQVKIIAPNGKAFFVQSGDTVTVTYKVAISD